MLLSVENSVGATGPTVQFCGYSHRMEQARGKPRQSPRVVVDTVKLLDNGYEVRGQKAWWPRSGTEHSTGPDHLSRSM